MAHTRASLARAMALAEDTITIDGEALTIREVTLASRMDADTRARREDGTIDTAMLWASMVAAGAIGTDGQPLYTADDIPQIAAWRLVNLSRLGMEILALSEARPGDLKSDDPAADVGQLDAEGGAADS